jgi:RNA polymerase sigma factor (sigma-70 family)
VADRTQLTMETGLPLEESDRSLWDRAADQPDAFGRLFERHAQAVYSFCGWKTRDWSLAEDLTSIVFLEAWTRRRSAVITSHNVRAWLLGVANNVCRNSDRSRRRYRGAISRLSRAESEPAFEETVDSQLEAHSSSAQALSAIDNLSEIDREIVMLILWSGLTYEEAAHVLDIPIGTVRSRLSRARERLQTELSTRPPTPMECQ